MNPRLRRLQADFARMSAVFSAHPYIRLVERRRHAAGEVRAGVSRRGLAPQGEDGWIRSEKHQAELFLTLDYPRRPPLCRMLTPVFHPNIDPQKICIGDHWSAGQTLPQLAVRIAEMISFQSYNVKSPLNARAAAWAEQNAHFLPLEKKDLGVGL